MVRSLKAASALNCVGQTAVFFHSNYSCKCQSGWLQSRHYFGLICALHQPVMFYQRDVELPEEMHARHLKGTFRRETKKRKDQLERFPIIATRSFGKIEIFDHRSDKKYKEIIKTQGSVVLMCLPWMWVCENTKIGSNLPKTQMILSASCDSYNLTGNVNIALLHLKKCQRS